MVYLITSLKNHSFAGMLAFSISVFDMLYATLLLCALLYFDEFFEENS